MERIAEASAKVQQARSELQAAIDERDLAIIEARDAPTCRHSRSELRGAAGGLTDGGLQNVFAGAGRFDLAG